ncbi:DNA polymerase 1 [Plasmodium cynomolgi strain B]|uniref:DNA polymerase 1 n=1 Tax=Plasmodium cynomolgi (strain B) TaxID=1120755 RepID=K6UDW4_PLACD|nr:DNA polymerase 1 [Plasmodium cynomolgi strain B]GAB67306.1 DNA polymerase 1 [Plasmodium cynomolgi strain B]
MKLFFFLKRSRKHLRKHRNVHSDSYICRSNVRFFHTVNYAHLAHLVSKKRSNSDEASSLHALLSTLTKRRHSENSHYSEVSSHKGHTCHIEANHCEYKNALTRWKELVKIYISWFPEITEDKYKSKCFSLPTYLVIHVVVPRSDTSQTNTLQQFEEFNFDTLLKGIYRKGENTPDRDLHKYPPEVPNHSVYNAKGGSSPNGDNLGSYHVHYVIGRNIGDAYNRVESVVSEADVAELGIQVKDQTDKSDKREVYSERNYFFSINMLELKGNEADRELLNRCIRGNFTETVNPLAKFQPIGDHHPYPFLFIVYDYKTLIHVFNNIRLEVPNIGSVFDVYILSSLLQLVQRGEKLQNVFSAYAAESGGGMLSVLRSSTSVLELPTPLILCISEIERRGIFLNQKKIEEIHQSCSNPLVYKEEIEHLCECNINLNSSKQVSSLIYRHLLDLSLSPNVEVVTTNGDAMPHAERVNYDHTVGRNNSGKPLSHTCDGFYEEEGIFECGEENIGEEAKGPQLKYCKGANKEDTMRRGEKIEKSNLLRSIITNGNYTGSVTMPSLAIGTSEETKPFPQLNNTINEMRRSKSLQTNNKTLKLIVDEIERNEHITEKEKEKIKKIINNVKLYRESKKLFQNYIENLPKFIQKETNKIHCNFNQIGASTGRLSCEQPNLQNIHSRFRCAISLKGGDVGNGNRGSAEVGRDKLTTAEQPPREKLTCEVSPHGSAPHGGAPPDGENLITFDYKQMELFVMAYLSFDVQLLKMLQSGDVFVETAKVLFNTTQVTSELRRMTKTVIYGILYGQTENGLAKSLLISEGMASNLISNFFQVFPNVYRFMQMQKILLKHMNRVYTLIGRKRIIEPTIKNKYRISMNTPIQGCAADVMKFALLSCFRIMTHGHGCHAANDFRGVHGPHSKQDVHSTCDYPQSARLLEINNVSASLLEENKPFLKATKLILQVHDELLFESTRRATAPIIRLFSPVLENAFYNLIHYTNTCDRLVLLYDYMHDHISVQTYIEYLQLSNNGQTWDPHSYGPNDDRNHNLSNKLNSIFEKFNFMLPIKVETGDYYKEFS